MDTLEERQLVIEIQYVLEALIEQYNAAKLESQKYFIKLKFMDFVVDDIKDPSALLEYLQLQPEKFKPFISCLSGVKLTKRRTRTSKTVEQEFPEPQVVIYKMQGGQ